MEHQWDTLEASLIEKMAQQTVTCVSCSHKFWLERGEEANNVVHPRGGYLDRKQSEHFRANRFKCPVCSTEQCQICHKTPYHLGYTCKESQGVCCRYCLSPCESSECDSQECNKKRESACAKTL